MPAADATTEHEQVYRAAAYSLLAALLRAPPDRALLEHVARTSGSLAAETFLLSYRNFATPRDILHRLIYMYCLAPLKKSKVKVLTKTAAKGYSPNGKKLKVEV